MRREGLKSKSVFTYAGKSKEKLVNIGYTILLHGGGKIRFLEKLLHLEAFLQAKTASPSSILTT